MNLDNLFTRSQYLLGNNLPICTRPISLKDKVVPCGHCFLCANRSKNEWLTRLDFEKLTSDNTLFLTLTFNDDHLNDYSYKTIDLFLKRYRKIAANHGRRHIRYFGVFERGDQFNRPHFHLILFNAYLSKKGQKKDLINWLVLNDWFASVWKLGFAKAEMATSQSFNYVCKYVQKKAVSYKLKPKELSFSSFSFFNKWTKTDDEMNTVCGCAKQPYFFMSKGLGFELWSDLSEQILRKGFISHNGQQYNIPRSFLQKKKRELGLDSIEDLFEHYDFSAEVVSDFALYLDANNIDLYNLTCLEISQLLEDYYVLFQERMNQRVSNLRVK